MGKTFRTSVKAETVENLVARHAMSAEQAQAHFWEIVKKRKMNVAANLKLFARQPLGIQLMTLRGLESEIQSIEAKKTLSVADITILTELHSQKHFMELLLRLPKKISEISRRLSALEHMNPEQLNYMQIAELQGLRRQLNGLREVAEHRKKRLKKRR